MKKIKRALMMILALAMLLAAGTACGGVAAPGTTGGQNNETETNNPPTTPAPQVPDNPDKSTEEPVEPTGPAEPAEPVNELGTVEAGVLVMATNAEFPPYEFWEGDTIVGIDAEIAGAIAKKLGLTLRIDDIEFNAIITAVTGGRADMGMAGMTITEERMQSVDFSTSYATGVQVIIVNEKSPITSVDDLFADDALFNIGVQESTTGDLYTTWDLEEAGKATIQRYSRGADAVQSLVTGRVDCVVIDNEPAKAFVAMNPGLSILDTEFAKEDYAIAFSKDDAKLRDAVDNALRELIADGTVKSIIDKYIAAD